MPQKTDRPRFLSDAMRAELRDLYDFMARKYPHGAQRANPGPRVVKAPSGQTDTE